MRSIILPDRNIPKYFRYFMEYLINYLGGYFSKKDVDTDTDSNTDSNVDTDSNTLHKIKTCIKQYSFLHSQLDSYLELEGSDLEDSSNSDEKLNLIDLEAVRLIKRSRSMRAEDYRYLFNYMCEKGNGKGCLLPKLIEYMFYAAEPEYRSTFDISDKLRLYTVLCKYPNNYIFNVLMKDSSLNENSVDLLKIAIRYHNTTYVLKHLEQDKLEIIGANILEYTLKVNPDSPYNLDTIKTLLRDNRISSTDNIEDIRKALYLSQYRKQRDLEDLFKSVLCGNVF